MMSKTGLASDDPPRSLPLAFSTITALILILGMAGCQKEEKAAATPIRPVRTVTVELQEGGEEVSLTGEIQPRYQADLGFRVNGKILERPVDVGTEVKKNDLLARLDPQQYRQDLEVAKAEVAKAEAEVARSVTGRGTEATRNSRRAPVGGEVETVPVVLSNGRKAC